MKKIFLFLAISVVFSSKAQITLEHIYPGIPGYRLTLDKFPISGYKYTEVDIQSHQINIYNLNHSLFKTIITPTLGLTDYISYISEHLFDTDNQIEYLLQVPVYGPGASVIFYRISIYKENGTLMFSRDSASLSSASPSNVFGSTDPIYFDGTSTKMKFSVQHGGMNVPGGTQYYTEIYSLPGTIPCIQCSTGTLGGTTTALNKNNATNETVLFYPNPVSDQLKLKYTLPKDAKVAVIKITDTQGKLIEEFKVTGTFDYLYLPSDYNNGMYLYSLIVDGKTIKTEKILLNK